jgi:hypothetical protein
MHVWRVQGRDGRGPYAPGFSRRWVDDDGPVPPPTCFEEFGPTLDLAVQRQIALRGGACGCGVMDPSGIALWFTPLERHRLLKLRFNLVRLEVDLVLAQSPRQVVFWRRLPLRIGAVIVTWPREREAAV